MLWLDSGIWVPVYVGTLLIFDLDTTLVGPWILGSLVVFGRFAGSVCVLLRFSPDQS